MFLEIFTVSFTIFAIGISVSICIAFLYLLMRLIDKFINQEENVIENNNIIIKSKHKSKKETLEMKDDVPFSIPTKIETSFDGKRIGKI